MGKKHLRSPVQSRSLQDGEMPVVGGREPCPCGSGKRYKACHGKAAAAQAQARVRRPFEGLAAERDLVAFRELVPSATAPLQVQVPGFGSRSITLATVLPMAWPAMVRENGEIFAALQVNTGSGDASRDVADAILRACAEEPGTPVPPIGLPGVGPRLQDIVDADATLDVAVHEGFDFWIDGEADGEVKASLDRVSENAFPTSRLANVEAAYWTRIGTKEHLRWVRDEDEDELLTAFARLHAAEQDSLGKGTRFVGMFRSCGLLVPVWDLPIGFGAEQCETAAQEYELRLQRMMAETKPLSSQERNARAGLQNRQVTLK